MENTHLLGGALQFDPFVFHGSVSADINMFSDPYNHLQPSLHDFAFHAVQLEASRTRTVLQQCPAVDKLVYRAALAPLPNDIQGSVFGVSTLSIADQAYIHELDNHQSSLCVFCGKCQSSVPHIIFDCDHPKLKEARLAITDDATVANYERHILENFAALPVFLKHGIPPPHGPHAGYTLVDQRCSR